MPLPELTDSGELPLGVHRASLQETLERFAVGHPQRIAVGERLERIYHLATATAHLARFVVFGSFVTDQPEPNDVDVFLVMDDSFDGDTLHGNRPCSSITRQPMFASAPACFGSVGWRLWAASSPW